MVLENDSRGKLRPAAEQHTGTARRKALNDGGSSNNLAPENKIFFPVKSRITQPIANKEISFPHG
ncbi:MULTISPECIES: hypothetical protein [unclassified Pseudomonas]|uniref:hypothetical protein n=1 Tax=unclassified Pseudomonas TaxID=196821 RepID=UPI0030DA9AC7